MTKHEADVIGGLNMTDQISNEAYKQIMIAAQDENEPCDKCVYSTSEGCQYDDITETIPPFDDCINRQAVLDSIHANCVYENEYNLTAKHIEDAVKQLPSVNPQKPKTDWIVPIILIDEKGEEHDGLMDMRRMLIYLHNIPAETAISLGYTWKSAEGSDKE